MCFTRSNDQVFSHLNATLSSHTCTCEIIYSTETKVSLLWLTHARNDARNDEDDHLQLKWNAMHVSKRYHDTHARTPCNRPLIQKSDPLKAPAKHFVIDCMIRPRAALHTNLFAPFKCEIRLILHVDRQRCVYHSLTRVVLS